MTGSRYRIDINGVMTAIEVRWDFVTQRSQPELVSLTERPSWSKCVHLLEWGSKWGSRARWYVRSVSRVVDSSLLDILKIEVCGNPAAVPLVYLVNLPSVLATIIRSRQVCRCTRKSRR
ncbi:hypothetical protein PMIN05_001591 [Paraphaeosphaeria minitans]